MNALQDFQALSSTEQCEYERWQQEYLARKLAGQRRRQRIAAARLQAEFNNEDNEGESETNDG